MGPVNLLIGTLIATMMLNTRAYPMYFHKRGWAKSCTDVPSAGTGGHLPPTADKSISIEVALAGQPVSSLCPGQLYDVGVSFGSGSRAVLLTASSGSLAESNLIGCPNAMTTSGFQRTEALRAHWMVPCTASGTFVLQVTSATAASGALKWNTVSFPVLTGCAISSCVHARDPTSLSPASVASMTSTNPSVAPSLEGKGTPARSLQSTKCLGSTDSRCGSLPDTQGASAPQPVDDGSQQFNATGSLSVDFHTPVDASLMATSDGAAPMPTDDPAAQTLGLLAESAVQTDIPPCPASSLGYQCSQDVGSGVTIHYTGPGTAGQPGNSCTQGAGLDTSTLGASTAMMHFAIESTKAGYLGIGFPAQPGKMAPADAIMGSVDDATGAVQVDAYRLSTEGGAGVNVVQPVWTTGIGAVRRTTPMKATVVCFSRPLNAPGLLVQYLDPAAVPIIWAAHTSTNRLEKHIMQGSLTLNMQSGRPTSLVADDSYLPMHVRYAAQIAHGILMVLAFCVFMPAGIVVARHKWLFTHTETGKLSAAWFKLHQCLQQAAIVCLIASFVAAMTLFYRRNGTGSTLHHLFTPHFGMGVALPAAVLSQAVLGSVRPHSNSRYRGLWRAAHHTLGYGVLALGITNSFVGAVLMHHLKSMPWPAWLVPMCLMLGINVLLGLGLEVAKLRRWLQGRHSSKMHAIKHCSGAVPGPAASSKDDAAPSSSPSKRVEPATAADDTKQNDNTET